MAANDPPRIRDDRRDPEITRLKERMTNAEEELSKHEKQLDTVGSAVTGMNHTLYGIPQDHTSNGIVGGLSEVKLSLNAANNKLVGLLITAVLALAGLIGDIASRNL